MLMRFLLPVTIALATTSTAAAQARLPQCPAVAPAPPAAAPCLQFYLERRPPARAAPAADERVFCRSFFALSYSTTRRNPAWTSYLLTADMSERSDLFRRRGRRFAPQPGLTPAEQAHHNDWVHPPYARGHMVPDNDAPTCETQADTYTVSNIIPQDALINSVLWSQLEMAVHRLAISEHEVYIVTGPIFLESRPPMNGIAVPSAVFKALYVPSRGFALAFIASNEPPAELPAERSAECMIVPIAEVERQTGLNVFPALTASTKARLPTMPRGWGRFPRQCTVA